MEQLIQGLHRFQHGLGAKERQLFARLAHGQRPEALFVTCSDSRVVPHLITQAGPGELFVLQNAGGLVPPWRQRQGASASAATIEYAVRVLKVQDIVVCAHSGCGTMTAISESQPLDELPAMRAWLRHAAKTRRIMRDNYGHLDGENRLMVCTRENVLVQLENLRSHPAVADACDRGRLRLHGWIYMIASGEVLAYETGSGQFVPATATGGA